MVIAKIRAWWKGYLNWRRARKIERLNREVERRSREDIQIMEYRGKMFICYRGIPIVRASEGDLGCPWEELLRCSRTVYQSWLSEKELDK